MLRFKEHLNEAAPYVKPPKQRAVKRGKNKAGKEYAIAELVGQDTRPETNWDLKWRSKMQSFKQYNNL